MHTTKEIIAAAKSEIESKMGYSYCAKKLEELVAEGIKAGDRIPVGGGVIVTITDDEAIFCKNEQEGGRVAISDLSREQLGTLIKCKAKAGCQGGSEMGTPKF